jgi:hypothetical protein
VPVLTPDDLALCDHLRRAIGFKPGGEAVGSGPDQAPAEIGVTGDQLEALLERLLQGAPWPVLLERMTWFVQWLCGAPMGALFVYRGWGRSLLFERERGMAACGVGERLLFRGAAQRAIDELYIVQVTGRDRVGQGTEVVALPLLLDERPVGALVLALPGRGTVMSQQGCFALSWIAVTLTGLLSRGLQMEWTRESVLRDRIRRGIKEIIGGAMPAAEACRQGVELIAGQLAAASCRLYCRGPLAAGWVTAASAPAAQTARAQDEHPWEGTVMLTAASLEPLLLVQRPSNLAALTSANGGVGLLHLSFSLGPQGDGVLVIEHHGAQSWSVQLVELLKEMGQLLGSVTRRVVHREGSPRVAEGPA